MRCISKLIILLAIVALSGDLVGQSILEEEIGSIGQRVFSQINADPEIQTVAIIPFTDLDYHPNSLGDFLSEEFITFLFNSTERKFEIISRNQLARLMEEVKLSVDGLLAEGNIPKLKRLKGIDLIIGATLTESGSQVRLNAEGIEIETGVMKARANGFITLTPFLERHRKRNSFREKKHTSPPNTTKTTGQKIEGLGITCKGCIEMDSVLKCSFIITNESESATISFFGRESWVMTEKGPVYPTELAFGDSKSRSNVRQYIRNSATKKLELRFPVSGVNWSDIQVKGHSNLRSYFTLNCEK